MILRYLKILSLLLALFSSNNGFAESAGITGADLMKDCNELDKNTGENWQGDKFKTAKCISYVQAFVEALTFTNLRLRAQGRELFEVCLPDDVPVSKFIDIIRSYLKNYPQTQDLPVGVAVYAIFQSEYPCKPSK